MDVKTLDFSKFQGSEAARSEFAHELLKAFSDAGVVKLINHGFDGETMSRLFRWSEEFFSLPMEEKLKFPNVDGPKPQRGWSAVGSEKTGTLNTHDKISLERVEHDGKADFKEHFDIGRSDDKEFPNLWPSESAIPGFKEWTEQYFRNAEQITLDLLSALDMAMTMPDGTLSRQCGGPPASELRLNYFPATRASNIMDGSSTQRIWQHTDFGVMTLLAQDTRGGLEIEDRRSPGTFQPAPLVEKNELIVMMGDILERWTNGVLRATLHRVTAPTGTSLEADPNAVLPARFSVAFFLKPHRDSSAGPVKYLVDANRESQYEEMTAIEYQRLRTSVVY
ncbi:hypothetical protein PG987_010018 [Apiospora arundinis]